MAPKRSDKSREANPKSGAEICRTTAREAQRQAIKDMIGLGWEGDLDAMRDDAPRIARRRRRRLP